MDPGRAFGTGGHATTRLCLRFIDQLAAEPSYAGLTGPAILDIGCGCGVLSIGALLIWPTVQALGVDIDPEAIAVTRENAALNGVGDRMTAALTPVDEVPGQFALLLANITGPTLLELSKAIAARTAKGATVVVSGLLQTEAADIKRCYAALGLTCLREESEDEWAGLLLRKA
jgi:ribosomal protein L11 methyltransferase